MATEIEIAEVRAFLNANNGEWVDCDEADKACPSLLHRKRYVDDPIMYHINSVCVEADLGGGVEEHGYGDWLCFGQETGILN